MDPVQILLVAICILCCAYFTVPDAEPTAAKGRDFEHEHRLGAHRNAVAFGCRLCEERR